MQTLCMADLRENSYQQRKTMEELNVCSLPSRKESTVPLTVKRDGDNPLTHSLYYPLALVLRLRVLQIVCGISSIVMGSVAFIEERQFNMGLGIPAGAMCVLAAAVSIHTSKGVSIRMSGAAVLSIACGLWIVTPLLLIALLVLCFKTILAPDFKEFESFIEDNALPSARDLKIIASVQIVLSITSLLSVAICVWIEQSLLG